MMLQKVIRDNARDMEEFCKDLQEWEIDMEKKERKTECQESPKDAKKPKVRKVSSSKKEKSVDKKSKKAIIDYSSWDKFDAEAECAKLDDSQDSSDLTDECDTSNIVMANSEKEKGNGLVKKKEWAKALEHYTAAIKLYTYDPIYYANRALCYLKLKKYELCQTDCNKALRLDPSYVKAYHRRASALEGLGHLSAAHEDLKSILKLEPYNKEIMNEMKKLETKLEEANKKMANSEEGQRPKSKFTMSRQKKDNANIKISNKKSNELIEPVQSHVVERKPVNDMIGNIVEKTDSSMPSTSSSSNYSKPSTSGINKPAEMPVLKTIWPMGDDVEVIETIYKPPNQRSTKKLKRIQVIDVDTTVQSKKNEKKVEVNKVSEKQTKVVEPKEEINVELVRAPKTFIQFVNVWKNLINHDDKLDYLKKIDPLSFGDLFKESLSSALFSDIIATLAKDEKKSLSSYDYLKGLTGVKRFGALTMFMSRDDKRNLFTLVDYMSNDSSVDQNDVDIIIEKYELK